ncbi:MAG: hypothetical protein LBT59_15255 [Clostridiales bacterium]|jgi:hypothetical protein|nr:hypothetical protein [Clostridiales bacterium]
MKFKRATKAFLALFLTCAVALSARSIFAAQAKVMVNGTLVELQTENDQGRILVPYDTLTKALSAKVDYDPSNGTIWIYRGPRYAGMQTGHKSMTAGRFGEDETSVTLETAPRLIGGVPYVPLRAVAETLGLTVGWDGNAGMASIDGETSIAVTSMDELLTEVGIKATNLSREFDIELVGMAGDEAGTNICDYYPAVAKSEAKWWVYEADGVKNCFVKYKLDYFMYANIGKAMKTGDFSGLSQEEQAVYKEAQRVISSVTTPEMTYYEKEKAAHDYLVANTKYDMSAEVPEISHTPYGALINHVAVCNGYSDAFKVLMDIIGVPCDVVYGMARLPGAAAVAHSWNRVMLDGEYYLVDVTWDDPTPDRAGQVAYEYLNVTDEKMSKDRKPSVVNTRKKSVSTKYNYFVYEGITS